MPRLAIVISAVGSIDSLESTLVSVLENRPADCEIVVALDRPYDDPYELAEEVRFIPPARPNSAIATINRGLAATRAPFVHVLASGCLVSEGWADAALARFGDRRVGSVAPLVWNAERDDRILAAGVGYRRHGQRYLVGAGSTQLDEKARQSIIGPCGFAAFYRKAAIDFAGGFSTRLSPRHADADLALVLRIAGFTAAHVPESVVRAAGDVDCDVSPFRQALGDERLFRRNLGGGPGSIGATLAHWARVGLELAGSFPRPRMVAQLTGRMLACCEWGGYARHHRSLAELSARSVRPAGDDQQLRVDRSHPGARRPASGETAPLGSRELA